jgi:hypothetical protein
MFKKFSRLVIINLIKIQNIWGLYGKLQSISQGWFTIWFDQYILVRTVIRFYENQYIQNDFTKQLDTAKLVPAYCIITKWPYKCNFINKE